MKYRSALLRFAPLYDIAPSDPLFLNAMREITAFHLLHNGQYAKIARHAGFKISHLKSMEDLFRIPPLPTLFLKKHALFSVPQKNILLNATTSGTSGKKSTVGIDWDTGLHALSMVLRSFSHHKLFSPLPTNYIVLGYQPSKHNNAGIVKTAFGFTLIAPALHREYALKDTGTSYALNIDGMLSALLRYEKQGLPVRLMGLPAYHHLLLSTLKEKGIHLKLHPKSRLCLGGGWKQFHFEHADKNELYQLAQEVLGIPEKNCIDFFGAVEHPVLYCDCKNHHFHVPAYSRVIIRDPHTLLPVPNGTPGILNLVSPLMRSMPLHSILTDDLAVLHGAGTCTCGNPAPWFELLGRAGIQDVKTCAANAAQFLDTTGNTPPAKTKKGASIL